MFYFRLKNPEGNYLMVRRNSDIFLSVFAHRFHK